MTTHTLECGQTNRLPGLRTYLCASIDRCENQGRLWREEITPHLTNRGIIVFDPLRKPFRSCQDECNREERIQWVKDGKYDLITQYMNEIRGQDLSMVYSADFIIARIDVNIHATGTYFELAASNLAKKPVIFWSVDGLQNFPWWLYSEFPYEMVFGSLDEVLEYLDHVDTAPVIETYNRWYFFDRDKVYPTHLMDKLCSKV